MAKKKAESAGSPGTAHMLVRDADGRAVLNQRYIVKDVDAFMLLLEEQIGDQREPRGEEDAPPRAADNDEPTE